ncbi:MAG TPA: hypothetical protein VMU06_21185 [Stellaceae bacterium]|nr:hypothetical protein [Stellaceae bacterium]
MRTSRFCRNPLSLPIVALALALALSGPLVAAGMSCRLGAACDGDAQDAPDLLHPVTWFKGVCPRIKADLGRMPCARAVGRVETQSGTGSTEVGSGFLFLHSRELVTTAHGIKSDFRVRVRFRLVTGEFSAYGTVVKRGSYYLHGNAGRIQDVSGDWAIMVLDRAIPGARPLEAFSGGLDDLPRLDGRLSLVGFDLRDDLPHACEACSVTGIDDFGLVRHSCGASKGSSGGPLMTVVSRGVCEVFAMQIGEDPRARDGDIFDGSNANVAVSSRSFLPDAITVRNLLQRGLGAVQIKRALAP